MHHELIFESLKERRTSLGLSQADLAELSGVSLRTLKAIEGGKGNPTWETLAKLLEVLGLELRLEVSR